jgi:endonuclease III
VRRQERADLASKILAELFPETPIPLNHTDAYTLLVAVMLSAQTTDKKVNEVTPALFAKADNPVDMANLEVEEIRQIINQIGLAPTKAKNLKRMAEQLLERHEGEVLPDWDALENLAGVGHKTASVVMSQAFGLPAFPVDTHIHRLAQRWGLSNGKSVVRTEKDLKAVFSKDTWNKRHLQMIFFGRQYCPARGHVIDECPICSLLNS